MKRKTAILMAAILAMSCFVLTACGQKDLSNSKYLGNWKAVRASFNDTEATVEEVLGGEFVMELKGDGTANVTMAGEEMKAEWKETGDGIKFSGDLKLSFKDQDGVLDTSVIGVHFYLEKQ